MPPIPDKSQSDFADVRRKADEFARHAYPEVFARFARLRSGLDVNVPIVSAIIEREHNGEKEILVQTRWKPERDPLYSGTLEIPGRGDARLRKCLRCREAGSPGRDRLTRDEFLSRYTLEDLCPQR